MKPILRLSNIGKVIVLIFLFTSIAIPNNIFAPTVASASESNTISKIDDISATLIKGYTYELPSTVPALMSDSSTRQVAIVWQASSNNTSKSDKYIFYGTVQGYSRTVIATVYKKSIQSIADISATVNQGDKYTLPSKVTVTLNDNSTQQLGVTWSPSTVNTSTAGNFTFQGTVKGYDKKVILTLNVVPKNVEQEQGNTNGNLVNIGFVAQKGEWVYYRSNLDVYRLYKMKVDGTEETRLDTDYYISYINVVANWIYYKNNNDNLYKIKTDGTEKTRLNDDLSSYINVVGDWIYYKNDSDSGKLYKVKTDGTERTKLNDDRSSYINIAGGWIYYSNESDNFKTYKMKVDGTGKAKLNDDLSFCLNVVGDWIYYVNWLDGSKKIYKIKTDGTGKTKLNDDLSFCLNVVGDWIYYINENDHYRLYKIKTDGTGTAKLNDNYTSYINVAGDWIYYLNGDDNFKIYKMKMDGTERQIAN